MEILKQFKKRLESNNYQLITEKKIIFQIIV